ncbi:MAG: hypothetical protein AAGI90_04450 [Chlamydiota bacterium]
MNEKFLSIPPYITTAWTNVQSLYVQKEQDTTSFLVIELKNGTTAIRIPDLSQATIDQAFHYHTKFLEQEESPILTSSQGPLFKLGSIGLGSLDQLGSAMQHNPEQMHAPDLPQEFLKKVGDIAKALGMEKPDQLPKPEPHCNCPYCQVANALQKPGAFEEEELVSDEELRFRVWDVEQTSDQLYVVTNPLDKMEKYNVFLGNPIGCTCGQKNCEHIKTVLNS